MNSLQKINTFCLFTLTVIALAMSLIYTKTIMIPFVLSLFLYLIISPFMSWQQVKLKLNQNMSLISTIILFLFGTAILVFIINASLQNFLDGADTYKEKLINVKNEVSVVALSFGYDIDSESLEDTLNSIPIASILKKITQSILSILSNSFLIVIFTIFLLTGEKRGSENETFKKIKNSLFKYVSIKLALSVATGALSYIVFLAFGVELASMFALLTVLLNFIPNVGSIIAVALPLPILFLQFSLGWQLIVILILLATFQMVIGNVLEPKLLGDSIGLHPVVVLLSLTFWGFIWGIPGMFLSVPISASMKIIFESFEYTKGLAALFEGRLEI